MGFSVVSYTIRDVSDDHGFVSREPRYVSPSLHASLPSFVPPRRFFHRVTTHSLGALANPPPPPTFLATPPDRYLLALGSKRTAEVQRDAKIGEAEAQRDAGIRKARADQMKQAATFENEVDVAKSEVRAARRALRQQATHILVARGKHDFLHPTPSSHVPCILAIVARLPREKCRVRRGGGDEEGRGRAGVRAAGGQVQAEDPQ